MVEPKACRKAGMRENLTVAEMGPTWAACLVVQKAVGWAPYLAAYSAGTKVDLKVGSSEPS